MMKGQWDKGLEELEESSQSNSVEGHKQDRKGSEGRRTLTSEKL